MSDNTDTILASEFKIVRQFKASAERVFDAWLDPDGVGNWLFASADGVMQRVEMDPRVGGKFVISDQRGDELAEHFGTFLEIERPSRLVFSYNMDPTEPQTVVTIEIVPLDEGCRLTLSHDMDPKWGDISEQVNEGWTMILEGLSAIVINL